MYHLHIVLFVLSTAALVLSGIASDPARRSLDTEDDDPCMCPLLNLVICGRDGRTYSNLCVAQCSNTQMAHSGVCKTHKKGLSLVGVAIYKQAFLRKVRSNEKRQYTWCNCRASSPVCGVNGETYGNPGCAECFGVAVASDGACPPSIQEVQEEEKRYLRRG